MPRNAQIIDHSDVVTSLECLDRIVSEAVTDITTLLQNYCNETKLDTESPSQSLVEVATHSMLATPTGLRALFTVNAMHANKPISVVYDEKSIRTCAEVGGRCITEFRFDDLARVYEVRAYLCSDGRIALDVTAHHRTSARNAGVGTPESPPSSSRSQGDPASVENGEKEGEEEEVTQKIGTPYFYGSEGMKFMSLFVDIGLSFSPNEITVQILKDNIIQVRARHEEKDSFHYIKQKYCRDYELSERIEPYSLRGGLSSSGRLVVGALAKGHKSRDARCNPMMVLKGKEGEAAVSQPCNVLDLASFPPKAS